MFKLKGVIPPMITPFQEDGTLDEKSLIHLVEYLSGAGRRSVHLRFLRLRRAHDH